MNRRDFLQRSGALALGATTGLLSPATALATPPNSQRQRVLRAAHLTDIHVRPDQPDLQHPAAGMAEAIRHAQAQTDRPELLLFGGDCIGDALYTPKDEVLAQWDAWDRVFSAEVKTSAKLCLGNHDIYGWAHQDRAAAERDPAYGKTLALERMGLKDRYYSFDQAGWHFVVLDSMEPDYPTDHHYIARLDEAQFAWLARDLAATPVATPICVLSHIPIFSAAAYFDGPRESGADWVVPGAWMHIDARRIKDLFHQHPNVKVCLSGHLHMEDDVTYLGVRYLCNGAVCGGWWKGKHQEFSPSYALLDFYDDGSVENTLVNYRGA
ncbi:MAG: metallophosphoesterase [Candidatus Didemnitutus sp.]|nr:metallophosphoesterase [Candidatus Didemnitutus sp.]